MQRFYTEKQGHTVSDLFDKKHLTFEYHQLLKACTDISINISERDIKLIENDT